MQSGRTAVSRLRGNSQVRAQQLRQKARQTLLQKKRNLSAVQTAVSGSGMKSQQAVTNVKQRLGTVANQQRGRGRGRARGRGTISIATGRGQGQKATGGGRIKILR